MHNRKTRHTSDTNNADKENQICHLCASASLRYTQPSAYRAWAKEHRDWVNSFLTQPLSPNALVCRACEKSIKQHTSNPGTTPRWLQKAKPAVHDVCIVEGCDEPSVTCTSITTYEVASVHLDLPHTHNASSSMLLCNVHYQHLYREINFPQPCAACLSLPKHGENHSRKCPDPEHITSYLQENSDYNGVLTDDSKICKPSYTYHRHILQQHSNSTTPDPMLVASAGEYY